MNGQAHDLAKCCQLIGRQLPCLPEGQVTQLDRPHPHALQAEDLVPHGLEHPAYLTVPPLVDDESGARRRFLAGQPLDERRLRAAVLEVHAAPQAIERRFRNDARHPGLVLLLHLVTGMGQAVGELAVGGQEQEAGRVDVQPPDVPEVRRRSRQEVVDRLAPLLVVSGNDITSGLVEEDGRLARLEADRAAVDLDVLAVGEPDETGEQKIAEWQQTNASRLDRARRTLEEIYADEERDLATLSVAARQIRNMTRTRTGSNT